MHEPPTLPALTPVGRNATLLWGLTAEERLRRMAKARHMAVDADGALLVSLRHAFDPLWLRHVAAHPGMVVTHEGTPVLAHLPDPAARQRVAAAMAEGAVLREHAGLAVIAQEEADGILNDELRKRERPFMAPLTPATVPALERASYFGAYKGVTDVLTKYLWPEWALALTRIAARIGISPNGVTFIGIILCIVATILFWQGRYGIALPIALLFMVLDTVDGKLARCTITSSWWGNVFDHGVDLIHPPFWWYAWGVGLAAWGLALDPVTFWVVQGVLFVGYVLQRLIEGAFIKAFGMHIHVWRKFDSDFRLVTARRNPNMAILFFGTIAGRPDIGLIAVAAWTAISLVVHAVRLVQAYAQRATGHAPVSWLADY